MAYAKLRRSTISLRLLFSFGSLGFATHTVAADSVMDVLKPYYPLYNEALQCHGVIAPSGSVNGLTNEPDMTGYCIDIDRQKVVETDKGKRLYVLVTGDIRFDDNGKGLEYDDIRFDNGLAGMFVLKPKGSGWQVESAKPTISVGSFGRGLSDWRLQKLSPNAWGFLNQHSNALQGYYSDSLVILTPDGRDIRESWIGTQYNNEDAGKCEDDLSECDIVKTVFAIDTSKTINGFYPLTMIIDGRVRGKVYNNAVYRINYQKDKGYTRPENYPLKNMGY
ncbi:hypothetical protein AAJP47_03085 [Psychrobacter sp. B38]|uniref:hypothetical protein n=1 Tax=Psychrobacter sp. B38 TaxID=3143538 RepID=UPI00320E60BD